ncbi:MAG: hypothetical protein KBF48_03905 [Xanthomonadales bacterium]|nr:hypothetical protein [Xanthomonadales bacterium]
MTATHEMKGALLRNLKPLNAKERDHLMRDAYLGIGSAEVDIDHGKTTRFLSAEFDKRLKEHIRHELKLTGEARCVFAGMDYHLDWIFAALWMATQNPAWPYSADSTPVKMADHTRVENLDSMYTDFRPVMGIQEDIDLLAVYEVDDTLAIVFIEAKGSAAFDRVQLARKLIRLDRILVDSGIAKNCANSLPYIGRAGVASTVGHDRCFSNGGQEFVPVLGSFTPRCLMQQKNLGHRMGTNRAQTVFDDDSPSLELAEVCDAKFASVPGYWAQKSPHRWRADSS